MVGARHQARLPSKVRTSLLPAERPYPSCSGAPSLIDGAISAGSTRILQALDLLVDKSIIHLVDDDPAVRNTLARLLVSGGYRVREYASGADLVAAAGQLTEGCILLDINMPDANGFDVAKALTKCGIDLPVVMMTGTGDLTLLAWRAGVAGFVPKPFGRKEIIAVLDEITTGQFVATAT